MLFIVFNYARKKIDMKQHKKEKKEKKILLSACKGDKKQFALIQDLLKLEKSKTIMMKRRGLFSDMESRYKQLISE